MQVGEYLFHRLKQAGVTHTFGIPGDYALPLYAAQSAAGLKTVVMTHEPSAGYAADVFARLNGLGVALVTYGVGALNLVNAVAMAYAEESPVLVVAGAPDVHWQQSDLLFHHRVKNHETQWRVFREVTVAQASITSPEDAVEQIDEVLEAIRRASRPGFIEIARDITFSPARIPVRRESPGPLVPDETLTEAVAEIVARLNASRQPVIYAGVEMERFGLMDQLRELAEKINVPVATSLMGKAVLPERHPNFLGNYFGQMGQPFVRDYVENADCILALGMLFSDVDVAFDPTRFPRRKLIQATADFLSVSHHRYNGIALGQLVQALLRASDLKRHELLLPRPSASESPRVPPWGTAAIIEELNAWLTAQHLVIADTGDCLFASVELRADRFIGPGYYASMGLAIPGAVGAQLARPDLRPVVLVGDGAFKMTGVELGTARDHQLNPIVILLNNGSFATLQATDSLSRSYFQVRPWDYIALAKSLGGNARRVSDREQFRQALNEATRSEQFFLIDAALPTGDASPTLLRLGEQYGRKVQRA